MNFGLLQREQYARGGIGRWYWDYRDRCALSCIGDEEMILDIGCGGGITLEKVFKKFPRRQVLGIDDSPEHVQVCREFGLPVQRGDVCALEFQDDSVDCCLLLEVIEHLPRPQKALQEIHRILRPKGLLLLIFPNDLLFKIARLGFLKFREAFVPSGHVKQWTPRKMRRILEECSFRIQEMEYLPSRCWCLSLHCLVMARKGGIG